MSALLLLIAACGDSGESSSAASDPGTYPQRPIKVIIPFGAGGLADVTLRLAGEALGERLGENFVMENRPGAGGVSATSSMLNIEPDGHTLIVLTNGTTIAETQFPDLPYDITSDLRPVSSLTWFDLVFLTGREAGLDSLQAVLDLARNREGGLRIAVINPGSTQHLSAMWFVSMADIDANVITYRTTPDVLGALLRGEVDLVIDSYTALKGAIDNGDAVPVAVTGESPNAALPDVPTVEQAGVPGYVVTGWNALYTHAMVPPGIVDKLNAALREVTAMPEIQAAFAELGVQARASTPDEIRQRMLDDIEKWHAIMVDAGLAP